MARTADKNSTRQRAFAYLDTQMDRKREVVVKDLQREFNILESYAATLYQAHRAKSKDSGKLTEVFVVRDRKDGKDVNPYVSSHFVPKVSPGDATTVAKAKKNYEDNLKVRIAEAKKL